MAAQTQSTVTKLELAAFGRPANREDWTRDLQLRLGTVFLGSTRIELIKLFSDRLRYRAAYARPALDEIMSLLDNRPEGFLSEIQKVREILDRGNGIDFNDSSPVAEVFYSQLEAEADLMLEQQKQIASEWQDFQTYLDSSSEVVANIPRAIRAMSREVGQDRAALTLELRNLFANLYTTHPEVPPVVHLSYVWISLQNNEPSEDLYLKLALGAKSASSSMAGHFCCRLLSDLSAREHQYARASEWAKRALDYNSSAEANADLALLAAEMHEPIVAKPYLEEALSRRPESLVGILADERSVNLSNVLLDMVVRVQARLRRDGRQYVLNWASEAKEVIELQKNLGVDLSIGHELLESHKTLETRLAQADILTAGALIRYCEQCQLELQTAVKTSLEQQFDRQREVLTAARLRIDSVGATREERVQQARQENTRHLGDVNSIVSNVTAKGKGIEKQSLLWFGTGGGLFALFLLTKAILSIAGSAVEVPAAAGFLVLGIAGIPILLSIGLQVYHGLGRAALEISIRDKVSSANRKLRDAELEADDFHRDQITIARKNLSDAETQLKKIESALRSIQADPFEVEHTSPRLRAA